MRHIVNGVFSPNLVKQLTQQRQIHYIRVVPRFVSHSWTQFNSFMLFYCKNVEQFSYCKAQIWFSWLETSINSENNCKYLFHMIGGNYFQADMVTSCVYTAQIGLGLLPEDAPQFHDWSALREKFTSIFASKTQAEWCNIFDDVDACVTPVLTTDEAVQHPHNTHRASFIADAEERNVPKAAPRLSETPASSNNIRPDVGENSVYVLTNVCRYSLAECQALLDEGVVKQARGPLSATSRL